MEKAASIDNFLDAHRSDADIVTVGKLAIALAIANFEFKSALSSRPGRTSELKNVDNYFLSNFMKIFVRGQTIKIWQNLLRTCNLLFSTMIVALSTTFIDG